MTTPFAGTKKAMKNKRLENPPLSSGPEKAGKATYSKPVLRTFGSVKSLTRANSGSNIDGKRNNPGNKPSDPRIKRDVVKIGHHPLGIGLYLFDYKPDYREACGHGRQFGVMADEVEAVMPEAVSLHPDGYKQVNYAMLGIDHNIH